MNPNLNTRLLFWGMLSLYFLFLAYEVLHSDYLFTDEAFRLWQNSNRLDVILDFHSQGRAFGGMMCSWVFEQCHKVTDVKYIRLFSLAECLVFVLVLYGSLKRLQRRLLPAVSNELIYLSVSLVAASLSVANWIGWAVSTIIFIPAILSVVAGTILFESMERDPVKARFPRLLPLLAVILLSVAGLFFYQTPCSFLLLPFFLAFLTGAVPAAGGDRSFKIICWGVLIYLIILAIYLGLFRLGLLWTKMLPSDRTVLASSLTERLSFFFGYPMNQAFNGNLFFDVRSIVSQLIFPVLFLVWAVVVFRSSRKGANSGPLRLAGQSGAAGRPVIPGKIRHMISLRYILGLMAFWVLGFLPQLAGHEAYAPYRTMLVMTLLVFLTLVYAVLSLLHSPRGRMLFTFTMVVALLGKGAYNYKVYLADPLGKEYNVIRQELRAHYNEHIQEIVFIRPHGDGFEASQGIRSYKDEFGQPSTNKDWTPDPLMRQLVYELTGSRQQAAALKVTQCSVDDFHDNSSFHKEGVLLINASQLLNDLK
jgi:hypothetical protein